MPRPDGMTSRPVNNERLERRKVLDSNELFVAEPPHEIVNKEVDYRIELA